MNRGELQGSQSKANIVIGLWGLRCQIKGVPRSISFVAREAIRLCGLDLIFLNPDWASSLVASG